jgi:inhibitor of KinA
MALDLRRAYNQADLSWSMLSEQAMLLYLPKARRSAIQQINQVLQGLADLDSTVAAYDSIGLLFTKPIIQPELVFESILNLTLDVRVSGKPTTLHTIPICFELGPDLESVCAHLKLEKADFIHRYCDNKYEVAMCGFLPGFLYLDGLAPEFAVPRLTQARKQVPAGSIAIGGTQTGLYSLPSPGGWQLIARTPVSCFDAQAQPPMKKAIGDKIRFEAISPAQFNALNTHAD